MYLYFFDTWAQEKKFEPTVGRIQARLGVLGLTGKQERKSIFIDLKRTFREAVERGVHTIVAVGDDHTLVTAINIAAPLHVSVGFIPLVSHSAFANVFGIPTGADACDVIAKRLSVPLDVARLADTYFIGSATLLTPCPFQMETTVGYTATFNGAQSLTIEHLSRLLSASETQHVSGVLQVHASNPEQRQHVFSFAQSRRGATDESIFHVPDARFSTLDGSSATIQVDHQWNVQMPCALSLQPDAIKMIVGKGRKFGHIT